VSTLGHYLKRSREEAGETKQQLVAVELCRADSHLHRMVAEQTEPLLDCSGGSSAFECTEHSGLVVVLTCNRRIEVQRGFDTGVLGLGKRVRLAVWTRDVAIGILLLWAA
jgi:hypothetical protein